MAEYSAAFKKAAKAERKRLEAAKVKAEEAVEKVRAEAEEKVRELERDLESARQLAEYGLWGSDENVALGEIEDALYGLDDAGL